MFKLVSSVYCVLNNVSFFFSQIEVISYSSEIKLRFFFRLCMKVKVLPPVCVSAETFAPSLNIEAIQLFSHMIELSNRKNLIT